MKLRLSEILLPVAALFLFACHSKSQPDETVNAPAFDSIAAATHTDSGHSEVSEEEVIQTLDKKRTFKYRHLLAPSAGTSIWYGTQVTALEGDSVVFETLCRWDTNGLGSSFPWDHEADELVILDQGKYWAIKWLECPDGSDACGFRVLMWDRTGREIPSFGKGIRATGPFDGYHGMHVLDDHRVIQRNMIFNSRTLQWSPIPGCIAESAAGILVDDHLWFVWENRSPQGKLLIYELPSLHLAKTFDCECVYGGLGFGLAPQLQPDGKSVIMENEMGDERWRVGLDPPYKAERLSASGR